MSESFFQILSRVYTFTAGNWPYVDQKELCPYRLAASGYLISKPFVLECHVCHNIVTLPQQFETDYTATIQQLRNHKSNCIYNDEQSAQNLQSNSPISKESIYLIMDEIILQLKQSATTLNQAKKYPLLNKSEVQKYLAEDSFTFKSIDQAYKLNWSHQTKITFFLQFFGWVVKKAQNNLNAECLLCGRNFSLSNTRFIDTNDQEKSLSATEEECFSPVSEHRYFCLWVNPKCSGFKGFSIYIQYLFDKITESKSLFPKRQPQETKKIRVELDKYLQSFQSKTSDQFQKIKNIFNECQGLNDSISQEGQNQPEGQKQFFEQGQKRMKEFVTDILGEEMRGQIKKIKLT